MNWSRIKTILIILFLFTDIFLAASIFTAERKETEISPEVLRATKEILQSHNITIDNSVILPHISSASILQADNAITDYDTFAALLLGDDYYLEAPEVYSSEKGKLAFSGDRFSFKAADEEKKSAEQLTQKSVRKILFSELKTLGFDMSRAKVVQAAEKSGIWSVRIQDFAENRPVFSSDIEASVSADGILSLYGSWFNLRDNREQSGSIKGITGILIEFAEEYSRPAEITAAEYGYSVFDNDNYHKSASLIPVCKIILKDGTAWFTDARGNEQ